MRLAGLGITDDCALKLVKRLRRADLTQQADTIEGALVAEQPDVALTIPDRVAILTVDDSPPGLEELRAVLLQEHVWRQRDGLA
jgi:hypothetical protein